jgi:hypothetical protein
MESKIQKMLDHLQSETQIGTITAFGHSVSSYTSSLRTKSVGIHKIEKPQALAGTVSLTQGSKNVSGNGTTFVTTAEVGQWLTFDADSSGTIYKINEIASDTNLTLATPYNGAPAAASKLKQLRRTTVRRSIDEILSMPLKTENQADDFMVAMKELKWGLEKNQTKLDAPIFGNWQVAGYLERAENQGKEGWPEVLGIWCQTYIDLLTANVTLSCLADPRTLERRLIETQETNNESPLPPNAKRKCHGALINLKALVNELRHSWESDKKEMLKIVEAIRPVAQERGLYAHLGYWQGSQVLYTATGNGRAGSLGWAYKKNTGWLNSISLHIPKSQIDSFTPKYEMIACETRPNRIGLQILESVTGDPHNGTVVIDARYNGGERFLDVSAIAINDGSLGIDHSTNPLTLVALAIEDNAPNYYMNYYTIDKNNKSTRVNTEPYMNGARDIRILYLPPTTLPDDPDADAMADGNANPPGPQQLSQKTTIVYGGVRNRNHLHVLAWNSVATVEGPTNWAGYNGIEIDPYYVWVFGKGGIACATHASVIKCRQGKIQRPSWIYHDFDKQFAAPEVKTLYPCADGTLIVCMQDEIYTANYEIKRDRQRIVTGSWVKRGGNAKQVIKMPIPCWSVLESLKATLQAE